MRESEEIGGGRDGVRVGREDGERVGTEGERVGEGRDRGRKGG